MLKLFRRKVLLVRLLLFLIVGGISLIFVIQMVPGLGGCPGLSERPGVLAKVGEQVITQTDVEREYRRRAEAIGEQSALFRQLILERVIEELIQERVVEYEAGQLGLEVPPEEVAARLRQISAFYPGGKFVGAQAYQQIVQREFQMSVPEFEAMFRRRALQNKVLVWVTGGLIVSPAEVEQEYRWRSERVQLEYVLLKADEFGRQVAVSEEELRGYFEQRKDRYRVPERRAVRAVLLDFATLRQRLAVSPRELEAYYESHRDSYWVPEQVRVRHILFLRQPPGLAVREPAELRKKAEELLAQLRRGKDFAALARQHSDDSTTRERGGEIGWVRRGQAVRELEQVLFSLPVEATELVETSYAVHVVQVLERQAERMKSLAEVRGEIEPILKEQKVRQAALDQAKRIDDAGRAGKTLNAAAAEVGWSVQELPPFAPNEFAPSSGNNQDLKDWVFRLPAESAGQPTAPLSEPISLPTGYVLVQLKQVIASHAASFDEVRGQVEQSFRQERGAEQARAAAERLAAEAQKAGELRRPAQAMKLAVTATDKVGRDSSLTGLGPVRDLGPAAFSSPVGTSSPAVNAGGNWVVYRLVGREEADPARFSPADQKGLRDRLLDEKRSLAWNIFAESLEKRLTAEGVLQRNEAAIKRLTGKS